MRFYYFFFGCIDMAILIYLWEIKWSYWGIFIVSIILAAIGEFIGCRLFPEK
jgi:hypothetical protein